MIKLLLILFILSSRLCFAQSGYAFEPFKSSDYPSKHYQIKRDTAIFHTFKIEIIHVKSIDNYYLDSTSSSCRGWFTISKNNVLIAEKYFKYIDAVGGSSGLFFPDTQARNDCFIFSKFGDYDGAVFILDSSGKLTESLGGTNYISKDKRYLFSNYSSDVDGLTVFDLQNKQVVYTVSEDTVQNRLGDWFYQDGEYLARVYDNNDDDEGQTIKIARFDFKTKKLIIRLVDKTYLKEENRLSVNNSLYDVEDCNCGR